jgi:hypothetical protein
MDEANSGWTNALPARCPGRARAESRMGDCIPGMGAGGNHGGRGQEFAAAAGAETGHPRGSEGALSSAW